MDRVARFDNPVLKRLALLLTGERGQLVVAGRQFEAERPSSLVRRLLSKIVVSLSPTGTELIMER